MGEIWKWREEEVCYGSFTDTGAKRVVSQTEAKLTRMVPAKALKKGRERVGLVMGAFLLQIALPLGDANRWPE